MIAHHDIKFLLQIHHQVKEGHTCRYPVFGASRVGRPCQPNANHLILGLVLKRKRFIAKRAMLFDPTDCLRALCAPASMPSAVKERRKRTMQLASQNGPEKVSLTFIQQSQVLENPAVHDRSSQNSLFQKFLLFPPSTKSSVGGEHAQSPPMAEIEHIMEVLANIP